MRIKILTWKLNCWMLDATVEIVNVTTTTITIHVQHNKCINLHYSNIIKWIKILLTQYTQYCFLEIHIYFF